MTGLFDECQCGFVLAGIKGFARDASWLQIGQFQNQITQLDFWCGHFKRNCFGFAGSGRPVQKLQLGIACRDALGIDRTPRVFHDLQKQQFRTAWLDRNLRPDRQQKRFIDSGNWRKTLLGLGNETKAQQTDNQKSTFHGLRLNAINLIDMSKQIRFVHSRIQFRVQRNEMKKILLAGLLALCFSSLVSATAYPLTLKDDLGRSVKLNAQPKRIVSMMPSHTETLFAVGAGEAVIGVDEYSNYPKLETDKLPKTGNGFAPNLEAITALKPDLVLTDESSGSKLVQNLEKLGITVYAGVAQSYNDVFEKINVIGKITNHEKNALNLITKMRSELNAIQADVAKLPRVSVYFEVDPTPYAAGSSSFIGALIDKAGGNNIVPAKLGAFPQISPELVIQSNPDVILGADLADLLTRPAWDTIKAVKNKRVINFSGEINDAISRPGPRLAVALKALAKALHPEL
jgi:iron complex transport system substrate-binding protein